MPDGVYELRGESALAVEYKKRQLIDLYINNSYNLIIPPLVGFAKNDNVSFKFTDSISDETLEILSDITPQLANIDANCGANIQKYCYANQILKPYADDFYSSRTPLQVGCEIYGDNSIDADAEVINTMLISLQELGLNDITLILGNIAIINQIIIDFNLERYSADFKDIFKCKSIPDLQNFIDKYNIKNGDKLCAIILNDGIDLLNVFAKFPQITEQIEKTIILKNKLNANVICDFSDINDCNYHNGISFTAYHKSYSKAIARGGRYDNLAQKNRPAVGFSFDLKFLTQ